MRLLLFTRLPANRSEFLVFPPDHNLVINLSSLLKLEPVKVSVFVNCGLRTIHYTCSGIRNPFLLSKSTQQLMAFDSQPPHLSLLNLQAEERYIPSRNRCSRQVCSQASPRSKTQRGTKRRFRKVHEVP